MACIVYRNDRLQKKSLDRIKQINAVIADYAAQGYSLTLRQVYYQLVARGFIENSLNSYKNIGAVIKDGRYNGLIDWEALEDRTRYVRELDHYETPRDIMETAARAYHRDLWEGQEYYLEVWTEKDALIGVIERTAHLFDVSCFSCRGYTSTTALWETANRLINHAKTGRYCVIIHLGDHDPSGVDMTRDIETRLIEFGARFDMKRIALNRDQIDLYKPPPQPAKTTDTRYADYTKAYGNQSWELDALDPATMDALITAAIETCLTYFYITRQRKDKNRNGQSFTT